MPILRQSTYLQFQGGGSDKVYNAFLEEDADPVTYVVRSEYGRRGSILQEAVKGRYNSLRDATDIYNKLVNSKLAKGYVEANTPVNNDKNIVVKTVEVHHTTKPVGKANKSTSTPPTRKFSLDL